MRVSSRKADKIVGVWGQTHHSRLSILKGYSWRIGGLTPQKSTKVGNRAIISLSDNKLEWRLKVGVSADNSSNVLNQVASDTKKTRRRGESPVSPVRNALGACERIHSWRKNSWGLESMKWCAFKSHTECHQTL